MLPKNRKALTRVAIIGFVALIILGIWYFGIYLAPYMGQQQPQANESTFSVTSYVDGEDVSDVVPLSISTPKSTAEFNDIEDIYTMTNFQETIGATKASGISIDLSEHEYVWVHVDPNGDTPFAEDWILLTPNGQNYAYSLYAKDPTTDVNFNIFDQTTLNEITVSGYQTNGNYTLIFDCPHHTETASQLHVGTNWDMSTSDFNDLTASQKEEYYDEANWAGQFPLFDPNDFTYKTTQMHPVLAGITDAFCFKFAFNTTISVVDGNAAQVNFTISDDNLPIESVISGQYLYLIYYQPVIFKYGLQSIRFEISFGADIALSDVDSGNVAILQSGNALGTFTKLSDIAA